ncbi:MAG: glycosyltransferase family 2 protein [Clostridiales bacterium]|nr:glycosyltransferase family 2 protein [Clostridiales bacterium]
MISVIIPVYNAGSYLKNILNALYRQTYHDIEIILVDDGSSDDSIEVIRSCQKLDGRIRYISCEHCGVSFARNVGIDQANGEYIRFLDADDQIPNDSMEKMVYTMDSDEEIDLLIGSYHSNSNQIAYFEPKELNGKTEIREFINEFARSSMTYYYGVVWNKLYKKEIIDRNHIRFDEQVEWCEDLLFNLKYYRNCRFVYYLREYIYEYVNSENSVTWGLKRKIGVKHLTEINQYRYQKSIELIEAFGCDTQEFTDTWKYLRLKADLNDIAGFFSGKGEYCKYRNIRKRYYEMHKILSTGENRDLLRRRYLADPDWMVRMLYNLSIRERYGIIYVLILMKDFIIVHASFLRKYWNKRERKGSIL